MSQRTAAPHTSPSDEDVEQDEERQQMKEVNRAVEWRERLTPQMIMNGAMEWEHNGTDETEEGVEGSQVRVRGPSDRWPCLWWGCVWWCVYGGVCVVVCRGCTSCTRVFRSACVRVTAVTFAPQRARARAVALPIPETANIHKHKDLIQSELLLWHQSWHTLTHTFHTCLRLCHTAVHQQKLFKFLFLTDSLWVRAI